MSFSTFLLQTATTAAEGSAGGGLGMLIPLILIVVIMYFFMIRPQNKKQKETQKMLDALKKGDKVITIGGIHGVVTQTKEQTVVIKVDDGTKIEFNRSAISSVITDKPATSSEKPQKKGFFNFGKKAKSQVKDEVKKDDSKVEEKSANEQKNAVESEKVEVKSETENKKDEKDSAVKEVESGDKKDE